MSEVWRKRFLCICTLWIIFSAAVETGQTTGGKKRWLVRQPPWRNGFTGGGLWSHCSPHFWNSVFIQSIYLFLTEVPGICSILELCLNGFPISVAHSHWTDPRPSIFFPLKEWMGANFPFKHPPLPTCCKDHLGSFHTGGNLWRFDS